VRVGVDATCWANDRGYGRFAREIVTAMVTVAPEIEFVCFLDAEAAARFELHRPNVRAITVALSAAPSRAASAAGNRSLPDMFRMTAAVAREKLHCFFSPSVYTYFPLPPGLPAVITIHDAIAERFPTMTLPSRRARIFWRLKVWLALKQARHIVTVSGFAARDIARIHRLPADRLTIALEAPAAAYVPQISPARTKAMSARVGVPAGAPWFTYVGGLNPHKNVPVIVRAHAELAKELGAHAPHLVLVGAADRDVFHGDQQAIRDAITSARTDGLIHWAGFLDDADIAPLHAGAIALLLPSECEGFGLPAVEAAACGAPVIATLESPLPELLEGGGIFVAPHDQRALLDAMRQLTLDPGLRSRMGVVAARRARELTWTGGAESCIAALRRVVT